MRHQQAPGHGPLRPYAFADADLSSIFGQIGSWRTRHIGLSYVANAQQAAVGDHQGYISGQNCSATATRGAIVEYFQDWPREGRYVSPLAQGKVSTAMIDGFKHLEGYFDGSAQDVCLNLVRKVLCKAPLFRPLMPRSGRPFSVLMSNCGALGWVSDKDGGYRYQAHHPETLKPWPKMPELFLDVWADVAGWPAPPEACLINFYDAGTKMGSHVDRDEVDQKAPVVSISLGDDAVFHVGGLKRSDRKERITLRSGDIVVLGGASRLAYHGIDRVIPGTSQLLAEGGRINLTMRRVSAS